MAKEIKIEDFIPKEELESMSVREREIYERVFLTKKEELQGLTDVIELIKNYEKD